MKKIVSFEASDNLKNLEGFTKTILSFNQKKYSMFKDMANKHGWDSIYVNDIRYDLLRMAIMDFHISKGFFTISDLTGITDLNIRSIERFLKKIFVAGHNGMVGSALVRILSNQKEIELITKDRKELDLINQNRELMSINFDSLTTE